MPDIDCVRLLTFIAKNEIQILQLKVDSRRGSAAMVCRSAPASRAACVPLVCCQMAEEAALRKQSVPAPTVERLTALDRPSL